jgi:hypothetical protein
MPRRSFRMQLKRMLYTFLGVKSPGGFYDKW